MPEGYKYYRFGNVAVRESTAASPVDVEVYSWDDGDWVDSPNHRGRLLGFTGEAGMSYEEITKEEAQAIIDGGDPDLKDEE